MMTIRHGFPVLLLVVSVLSTTTNAARLILVPSACSKIFWPEVVGMEGTKAREHILALGPQCHWDVQLIPAHAQTTCECRPHRVRIFLNKQGRVQMVPVTCVFMPPVK